MTRINSTYLIIALIVIGLGVLFFLRECKPRKDTPVLPKIDTVYITVRDTVEVHVPVPYQVIREGKPYPVTKIDTEFLTITQRVDTLSILHDYFAKRFYRDTAHTTYGNVYIMDTVTQNKISYRQVIADWKVPEIHSVAPAALRNKVYFSLNAISNGRQLGGGPGLLLLTKREHIYAFDADYIPTLINPFFFQVKTAWKIHL